MPHGDSRVVIHGYTHSLFNRYVSTTIALALFKTPNYNSTIWLFVHPYTESVYDKIRKPIRSGCHFRG